MLNHQQQDATIESNLIKAIKDFGWTVGIVEATDYLPSFAYTIGLWKNFAHPELISFGLTPQTLRAILNIGGELVKSGQRFEAGIDYSTFFDNAPAQFVGVDSRNLKDYFGYAVWFNHTADFPALQLVWTDRNNRYPWDVSFDDGFADRQPLLDRNADFKFREARNVAVFTTRQWLEESKPILRVVHDDDGEWQFLTNDQMPEDIRIVALEQMVLRDLTLNDVFNLDYGQSAAREFVGDNWVRQEVVDEEQEFSPREG